MLAVVPTGELIVDAVTVKFVFNHGEAVVKLLLIKICVRLAATTRLPCGVVPTYSKGATGAELSVGTRISPEALA